MRSSDFYDLVSGRRRGVIPAMARAGLAAAEGPYRLAVWWRNRRYDRDPRAVTHCPAPVVSVGNLTLGGTGKTPMVKWVARFLRDEGARVAILSRGYGAAPGRASDEGLELSWALPDVPHLENRDRVAGARTAVEELASQVIVLDDGFQHRRLGRELDIVLIDATQPFGFDRVFPRGALREPVASLRRADVVCLTRSDLVTAERRRTIHNRVASVAPDAAWCESIAAPTRLVASAEDGAAIADGNAPLERLLGARVAAFCGVGNPEAFHATLLALGADVVAWREFADHHPYDRGDVEALARAATDAGAVLIVTTQKDLVKLRTPRIGDLPLWAVAIETRIALGEEALAVRLKEITRLAPRGDDPLDWQNGANR
ncbi:MAG: tetraacyldisaccharide 4'-kinase [Planctomycetota bacterium]